ncbi:MAG: glycoside hydrolase family 99-like domain-containing protein [Clostridia bacterium]|nr:glycoside hydrolase family 99-like domain-containing protein [Clostridia bacterium]
MKRKFDVAAFVWPAYTGDELRTRIFWPKGIGEWEAVQNARPKFEGHKWPRKPLWGYVNEADKSVMEMEIDEAVSHGVNVFIYDWYWYDGRPFLENCLNDGFLKASNNDRMKFYIMWANHNIGYSWDIRNSDMEGDYTLEQLNRSMLYTGRVSREQFEAVADRLIDRYFKHPRYYMIDGKPVFMIFTLPILIEGLGGVQKTKEALDWLKSRCVEKGLKGVHLQLNMHKVCYDIHDGDRHMTIDEVIRYFGFESCTNYQMVNVLEKPWGTYADAVEKAAEGWERLNGDSPVPYFPQVSCGWDNNPRFRSVKTVQLEGACPALFKKALMNAKAFLETHPDRVPLVTINSWNEWTEGSYLEPDDLFGYGYLDAVKEVFGE